MAAYNGERFISKQIDSILKQTYTNWRLFIRDDRSEDGTVNIIKTYEKLDNRITLVTDKLPKLGSCQNFSALMNCITDINNYIMFADQDDIWLPDKIEDTLKEMMSFENKYESDVPVLIHTNFQYVDYNLEVIKSKENFQAVKISDLKFAHLLAQNPVYGCTMMMNKKLVNVVKTIPVAAENHDYWIALVASAFGKICYLNKKTILYRQHQSNVSGNYDNNSLLKRFQRIINKKNFKDVSNKIKMALEFKRIYLHLLNQHQLKIIDDFINLSRTKSIRLLKNNLNNGLRRQTIGQTILFYVSIMFNKNIKRVSAIV